MVEMGGDNSNGTIGDIAIVRAHQASTQGPPSFNSEVPSLVLLRPLCWAKSQDVTLGIAADGYLWLCCIFCHLLEVTKQMARFI